MVVMPSDRLEGAADVGPYGVQEWGRWRPVPARSTVLELLLQRLACACTRGDGGHAVTVQGWRPTGLAPPPNPVGSQESKSRVQPVPLRGLGALVVLEQAHGVTGLTLAALHSPSPQ
jgi:hypothetical protein